MSARQETISFKRIFLDSAPVIYLLERHPRYVDAIHAVFSGIFEGTASAVTSPLTLTECMVGALRRNLPDLAAEFRDFIVNGMSTQFHTITEEDGVLAAHLSNRYGLRPADGLQLAIALNAGCDAFLTNDYIFRRVTEMHVIVADDLLDG